MNKEEHYKNNLNDRPLEPLEKKLMSQFHKLKHKMKVYSIEKNITIRLRKSQIRADSNIKNMFEEMYPEEYKLVIMASILKHGATPKKDVRREEIIQSMNLKNRNILRERYGK